MRGLHYCNHYTHYFSIELIYENSKRFIWFVDNKHFVHERLMVIKFFSVANPGFPNHMHCHCKHLRETRPGRGISAPRAAFPTFSISADRWESNHWAIHRIQLMHHYLKLLLARREPCPYVSNAPWLLLPFVANCAYAEYSHRNAHFAPQGRGCRTCVTCNCTRERESTSLSHPPPVIQSYYVCALIWYIRSIT